MTDTATAAPDQALKDLITQVGDLCTFLGQVSQGFQLSELWEGIQLLNQVKGLLPEAPAMLAQYKGLDDAARSDLYAAIAQNIAIPENATVQLVVEKVLDVAVALSAVFQFVLPKAG